VTHLPLQLTGRSSSHFTRVARMFADELQLAVQFAVVHDLLDLGSATFGGNPALKLPTLQVGDALLWGTENICRKLVELADRQGDVSIVLAQDVASDLGRNAQELVWHSMAAQVQLRMGVTMGKLPADNVFFTKIRTGMLGALTWLEGNLGEALALLPAPRQVSLFEVTLFCLLEHVAFCPTVPLDDFSRLRAFAATFGQRPSARRTAFQFDPRPERAGV
jgi:glutathione S-transferase